MNEPAKCKSRSPGGGECQGVLRLHAQTSEAVASCVACGRVVGFSELVCCGCYTRGSLQRVETGLGVYSARCRNCGGKYNAQQLLTWRENDLVMLQRDGVKVVDWKPPMPGVTSINR